MIFETYHMIPNVNESNNKFYFGKDDAEITIIKGSYEVRDINKFLKRAILRKHPPSDALEIINEIMMTIATITPMTATVPRVENPITLRVNYNTMRCEIRCAYRINFGKPNSVRSLGFSSKRIL